MLSLQKYKSPENFHVIESCNKHPKEKRKIFLSLFFSVGIKIREQAPLVIRVVTRSPVVNF